MRTLGQARQFLAVIALWGLVSLIIALAQVYSADDIVRRLVRGFEPAELARRGREQPTEVFLQDFSSESKML